jgi:hypothetical protein
MERDARRSARRRALAAGCALLVPALLAAGCWATLMPGKRHAGPLPPASAEQLALARELERDVRRLAGEIGERNVLRPEALERARAFVRAELAAAGEPRELEHRHPLASGASGTGCFNVWVELSGRELAHEIVVVGAHYDSVVGSPGANDNASGVAAVLALARRFAGRDLARTLRLAAFVNEEPPFFPGEMGSAALARASRERGEEVVAMLSVETIGYYSDAPGSQTYPLPLLGLLYPSRGDFAAFVGNLRSRRLVRSALAAFRSRAAFPSEGAALPGSVPGVGWSDQRSYWDAGYPGVMVTDTAPFRYPWYHTEGDTPDKLDYDRLARVVEGLAAVVEAWAGARGP